MIHKVQINDIEMAYYTRGQGRPLVMIMGFRGTMGQWDPALLEELEQHYHLILFDHRGVGLSTDSIANKTTIPQMAMDTIQLVKFFKLHKVNILGWSMGARIAQYIASTQPSIVDKLILCSPTPPSIPFPKSYESLMNVNLTQDELLSLLFPNQQTASEVVQRLLKAIEHGRVPNDLIVSQQTIERQIQALKQWSQMTLSTFDLPTLITTGQLDLLDPPENVQIIARQISNAWTAYFPNAGHAFLFQCYKTLASLIHIFLDENTQK